MSLAVVWRLRMPAILLYNHASIELSFEYPHTWGEARFIWISFAEDFEEASSMFHGQVTAYVAMPISSSALLTRPSSSQVYAVSIVPYVGPALNFLLLSWLYAYYCYE